MLDFTIRSIVLIFAENVDVFIIRCGKGRVFSFEWWLCLVCLVFFSSRDSIQFFFLPSCPLEGAWEEYVRDPTANTNTNTHLPTEREAGEQLLGTPSVTRGTAVGWYAYSRI